MTFNDFIRKYKRDGLIKDQKINFKGIENLVARAYKEITIAQANVNFI